MLAAAIAPFPLFAVGCAVTIRPSLGWDDMSTGAGLALAASYGVMLLLGVPADLILRRLGRRDAGSYVMVSIVVVWALLLALAWCEPSPPPPARWDASPFAGMRASDLLTSPFGIAVAAVSAIAASATAWLYWWIAVRPRTFD
jgi:hypothetical protein